MSLRSLCAALFHSGLISALAAALIMAHLSWLRLGRVEWIAVAAFSDHLFLLYLLDRLARNPEDENAAQTTSAHFVRSHRRSFGALAAAGALGLLALGLLEPWLLLAAILGTLLCVGYFLPLPLLGLRIKELPLAKGLYVPLAMLSMMFLYLRALPGAGSAAFCASLFLLMHVGTVVYDLKDLENDRRAGIVTLAGLLNRRTFLLLQLGLLAAAAGIASLLPPAPALSVALAAASTAAGCLYLWRGEFGPVLCLYFDGAVGLSFGAGLIGIWA